MRPGPVVLAALVTLAPLVPGARAVEPAPQSRLEALEARVRAASLAMKARLIETRRDLHRHPELSNREERTGRVVAARLKALGLEVREHVAHHGVVARLRGARPGPTVALRADMDALPLDETLNVPYRSEVKGVKHACGHDAHTAILLGVAEALAPLKGELAGDVLFVFQPAEESPPPGEEGGARLVIKEGALGPTAPVAVFGLHVMPTFAAGVVAAVAGPAMASSDRLRLTVRGKASHGAWPHEGVDAVVVAAEIVGALQTVRSRVTAPDAPFVLSIGKITGGRRYNIIADEVLLEGTVRALDPAVRARALAEVRRIAEHVAAAHGARVELALDDNAAAVVNDGPLLGAILPALSRAADGKLVEARPQLVAEDFSAYQAVAPGVFFFLGVRNEARGITAANHTPEFDLDEEALPVGVRALANAALETLARGAAPRP